MKRLISTNKFEKLGFNFTLVLICATSLGSSYDTFSYFKKDLFFLFYINIILNTSLALLIPLFLLKKINAKKSISTLIYLTIINILLTGVYYQFYHIPLAATYFFRDTIIILLFTVILCLVQSKKSLILYSIIVNSYFLFISFFINDEFRDSVIAVTLIHFALTWFIYFSWNTVKNEFKLSLNSLKKESKKDKSFFKEQIAKKDRELAYQSMMVANKERALKKTVTQLKKIKSPKESDTISELNKLISDLKFVEKKELWVDFKHRFEMVHPLFFIKLLNDYPGLTKTEQKLLSFLKLSMSSKEISSLTGNTSASIDVSRSRLRKKLNITSPDNLYSFVSSY